MKVNPYFVLILKVSVEYKGKRTTLKIGEKEKYEREGQCKSIYYVLQKNNGLICIGALTYNFF